MPQPGQRGHVISTRAGTAAAAGEPVPNGRQGLGHGLRAGGADGFAAAVRYKYKNASATVTLDHVESNRSV